VNHTTLTSATHDEAINVLRNSGSELTLTVKHYKSAAPFLLKNFRQLIPETEQIFPGKVDFVVFVFVVVVVVVIVIVVVFCVSVIVIVVVFCCCCYCYICCFCASVVAGAGVGAGLLLFFIVFYFILFCQTRKENLYFLV
jgi:hypothetical protein